MKRQGALLNCLTAMLLVLASPNALAQSSDLDAVKAANQAFYTALSARDIDAMQKVWSTAPDIVNIGPRSKRPEVGWVAIKKNFETTFGMFTELKATAEDPRVKINGSTAWVSTIERVQRKSKTGDASAGANFGTNIFVKEKGGWRMVYHHASAIPQ